MMSSPWPFNWIAFDDLMLVGIVLCIGTIATIFVVFKSWR